MIFYFSSIRLFISSCKEPVLKQEETRPSHQVLRIIWWAPIFNDIGTHWTLCSKSVNFIWGSKLKPKTVNENMKLFTEAFFTSQYKLYKYDVHIQNKWEHHSKSMNLVQANDHTQMDILNNLHICSTFLLCRKNCVLWTFIPSEWPFVSPIEKFKSFVHCIHHGQIGNNVFRSARMILK